MKYMTELETIESNTLYFAFLASRNMYANKCQFKRHLLLLSTADSKENYFSKDHALSSFQGISYFCLDGLKIQDFVCKWSFLNGES